MSTNLVLDSPSYLTSALMLTQPCNLDNSVNYSTAFRLKNGFKRW